MSELERYSDQWLDLVEEAFEWKHEDGEPPQRTEMELQDMRDGI